MGNAGAFSFERITRVPLRALARFGGSELAARLKLHKPAERALYHGARAGMQAIALGVAAAKRAARGDATRLAAAKRGGVLDLRPTEEQAMMQGSARRFAEEVLRPAARAADDAASPPADVLARSAELGLAPLAIPESLGGAATERSSVTSALVLEELARGDAGLALAIAAPLAVVNAIVAWGSAAQQAEWLPRFLEPRFVPAALALLEPRPLFDPTKLRAGAVRTRDGGWALYGDKSLVPLAASAELFLVAAEVRGVGPRLFVVPQGTPGLRVEPEPAMGLRGAALGRLRLDGAKVPGDALLGGDAARPSELDFGELVDRARVAWGAMAVGAARAVLDYVVPYCNERTAFGEPISHRQSVAFLVADVAIEVEGMRLLVHRAASRLDRGADASREATLARLQCATKGAKIGSDGVQLLGGHGFVKEHPVERWYRDLRGIGAMEGALLA